MKRKSFWFCLAVVIAFFTVNAQEPVVDEINAQIWEPFSRSYAEGDGDLHVSFYGPDIIRVSRGRVTRGSAYIERMRSFVGSLKERGGRNIAFRFTERSHSNDTAYEAGIYRLSGGERVHYGDFQVLIEKQDGAWKLVFDRDEPTDEAAWNAAPIRLPGDEG